MATLTRWVKFSSCFSQLVVLIPPILLASSLFAAEDSDYADPAASTQIERARAAAASELHLMATSLLDDLIYEWSASPPFGTQTDVALLGLDVPIGLSRDLAAILENHFFSVVTNNSQTKLRAVYCSSCRQLTTVATPQGTIIGRGFDVALSEDIALGADYGLFLDFEAEGAQLVLRARITKLKAPFAIVHARTLVASSASAPLLRDSTQIVSAAQARRDYLRILQQEPLFSFPVMLNLRVFPLSTGAAPEGNVAIPPMPWFEGGFATHFNRKRQWRGAFFLGSSSVKESHDAWSLGGSVGRLISDSVFSLTAPNVYLSLGSTYVEMTGVTASSFESTEAVTASTIAATQDDPDSQPRVSLAVISLSFDAFISQFLMAHLGVEYIPSLEKSKNLTKQFGFVHNYTLGIGVQL